MCNRPSVYKTLSECESKSAFTYLAALITNCTNYECDIARDRPSVLLCKIIIGRWQARVESLRGIGINTSQGCH